MSWFSREWDGVHLSGCPLNEEENDTIEVPVSMWHPTGGTIVVKEIEDSKWAAVSDDECTCPELMIEQAVGAAEMQRDAAREAGL